MTGSLLHLLPKTLGRSF
ncbi:unnamed protein product [Linum tenue]|uniref:Uncharacterized protein n=1 Tax=Linum tenue TaxID=586396 RepID=A0AAV0RGE9_9ROSI|nr:unnamed protein product [Linum tenue]